MGEIFVGYVQNHIALWVEKFAPDAWEYCNSPDNPSFHRGVHMTFGSLVVSIQWGAGNYCDNHDAMFGRKPLASTTAEVAVIDRSRKQVRMMHGFKTLRGEWCPGYYSIGSPMLGMLNGDTVQGYVEIEEIEEIIETVANYRDNKGDNREDKC